MKKLFTFITLIAFAACSAFAADYLTATATGTTLTSVAFPGQSAGALRLVALNCTADNATNVARFKPGAAATLLTAAALSTATNVTVSSTTGIVADATVIFQAGTSAAFRAEVYSVSGGTNVNLKAQLGTALVIGDAIWTVSTARVVPIGSATVRETGECLATAPKRRPLLVELTGTSAATINNAVAAY
jgi:hypothetical protein